MQLYDPGYVRRVEILNGGAPVRVCLESRMLRDTAGTGVATYARVLARCLADAGASPLVLDDGGSSRGPGVRALRWLAATRTTTRTAITIAPVTAPVTVPAPLDDPAHGKAPESRVMLRDVFREAQMFFTLHGRLLPVAFTDTPEVMHWTYPVPLFLVGAKNLYTIHDLIPLTHPELTSIPAMRHARILKAIAQHAHGLVTVSETIRQLVAERLAFPAACIHNTYQAVEAPLQSDPPLPPMLRSGRYFLFCGRVEQRKNLVRLAQAHAASGAGLPLVIVGPAVAGAEELERALSAFSTVIRLAWVPRPELIGLIRRARSLLFPSLAEGFGLPIVEAMTLGCPVLTSNRGAPAEIAGDAALLVSPESTDDIAAGIARLASDDRFCASLRSAGFDRGRVFSPHAYSRRLRTLYDDALSAPLAATGWT